MDSYLFPSPDLWQTIITQAVIPKQQTYKLHHLFSGIYKYRYAPTSEYVLLILTNM